MSGVCAGKQKPHHVQSIWVSMVRSLFWECQQSRAEEDKPKRCKCRSPSSLHWEKETLVTSHTLPLLGNGKRGLIQPLNGNSNSQTSFSFSFGKMNTKVSTNGSSEKLSSLRSRSFTFKTRLCSLAREGKEHHWGVFFSFFWQLTGSWSGWVPAWIKTLWPVTCIWAVVMGCFAMAGSLPLLSMWGTTWKAGHETGQWPEHSRKALLLGNMLLLVPQEFIDNKEKDTKYIWIGLRIQDMKKQWSSVQDPGLEENRWWIVGKGVFGNSKGVILCMEIQLWIQANFPKHRSRPAASGTYSESISQPAPG